MSELSTLLTALPVPEHRPGFWEELESRLAAVDNENTPDTFVTPPRATSPGIAHEPAAPAARRRRVRVAVLAAAVALVAVIIGFAATDDGSGPSPVITDVTSTTSPTTVPPTTTTAAPDEGGPESDAGPPTATADLTWTTPAQVASAPHSWWASEISWVGSLFAAAMEDGSLHLSPDGRTWSGIDGLPAGFHAFGADGTGETIVTWGSSDFDPALAVSTSSGDSWQSVPSGALQPMTHQSSAIQIQTTILDAAVNGDTIVVAATQAVMLDAERALAETGIELPDDAVVWYGDPSPSTGQPRVLYCERRDDPSDPRSGCTDPETFELDDLGIDTAALWWNERSALYRSVAGQPFESVGPAPVGPADHTPTLIVRVVDDNFVVLGSRRVINEIAPGFFIDDTKLHVSPDGLEWTERPYDGQPQLASTDTALFTFRGTDANTLARSDDLGIIWTDLPTPPGTLLSVAAGPGGVLIEGQTQTEPNAPEAVAWYPDGTNLEWQQLDLALGMDTTTAGNVERIVVGAELLLIGVQHHFGPNLLAERGVDVAIYVADLR